MLSIRKQNDGELSTNMLHFLLFIFIFICADELLSRKHNKVYVRGKLIHRTCTHLVEMIFVNISIMKTFS